MPQLTKQEVSIVSIPQHLTGFKPRLRFLKTFKNLENFL